ncbi:MAG: hypothetical protein ACP5T4_00090 [Candidatus Micrarchaeia archaeon]
MSVAATVLIAFLSIIVPGFALAYALLGKTKLRLFEIVVIGFIFGLIFPPALTWFESYFMDYIHAFTFSAGLFEANVVALTVIGIAIAWYEGLGLGISAKAKETYKEMSKEERKAEIKEVRDKIKALGLDMMLIREHEREEGELERKHAEELGRLAAEAGPEEKAKIMQLHEAAEKKLLEEHEREEKLLLEGKQAAQPQSKQSMSFVWLLLSLLMLLTFATRIINISKAPTYFEFDPYFDMLSTESILVNGYQYLHDYSAWPVLVNGSAHRMEPLIPYLEAYWYSISNPPKSAISTTLLSYVSSFYPPIVAALLVFVIFMFVYYEFGTKPALFAATLTASMSVLVTTFIAGEQLLEPWGIFSMFFFYAAYLLAINNKGEWRFAVLAGIAFVSTFLGAHYYTVDAGVLALYILFQGVLDVLRKKEMKQFYKMNAIVIGIIAVGYALFDPYKSSLYHRIPSIAGIPVIVSFPLLAIVIVALFEYMPKLLHRKRIVQTLSNAIYYEWLAVLLVAAVLLIFLTPLGKPVKSYISLSLRFTTPSIPLFMTVQEFEPTGLGFDFAGAGFGFIGINGIVWIVLILFVIVTLSAIFYRDSNSSMLSLWIVLPLAFAAMTEVKYLPHFGIAYIIALSTLFGELFIMLKNAKASDIANYAVLGVMIAILALEAFPTFAQISVGLAEMNNCSAIASQGNALGYDLFCNQVPHYWLAATSWMRQNVGPYGPRILSWWDYGDWINWFGNSNAVLRGDNAVPPLDYQTAARYVLGPQDGYGPASLASFANSMQAKYVLFDDALTQKWGALNFLACIDINETNMTFARNAANGTNHPYELGTSECEIKHTPASILIPYANLTFSDLCTPIRSLKNVTLLRGMVVQLVGDPQAYIMYTNITYCIPLNATGSIYEGRLYYPNGTLSNAVLVPSSQFFEGPVNISGNHMLAFMLLYLPEKNGTMKAPSEFYSSNYYQGFYLGKLPGFKLVYPSNFTGINYVNGTHQIMIYALDNFTGTLPGHTPKPSWVHNNYTMPG